MSGATAELTTGGLNREQDEAIQQLWQRQKCCPVLQLTEKTTRSLSLNSNQVVFWQAVR